MSDFWLRCDACNKQLRIETDQEMQLCVRFKPSLFQRTIEPIHPLEQRCRCRSCGWVSIFVPVSAPAVRAGQSLTPNWRNAIVLK